MSIVGTLVINGLIILTNPKIDHSYTCKCYTKLYQHGCYQVQLKDEDGKERVGLKLFKYKGVGIDSVAMSDAKGIVRYRCTKEK